MSSSEFQPRNTGRFRAALLRWYAAHRRELPWRGTRDPYRIWVSEIMLQQTRVAAVMNYYARFLSRFPDVGTLARARTASVLAAWSGLGYYRRARNLHLAARKIVRRGGRFLRTAAELRTLPGIGRYTAAAIASIAFGEPTAVVDGNVARVLHRMADRKLSAGTSWEVAGQLLSPVHPGDFNQAMMELGAVICLPGEPRCGSCPVARWCAHHTNHSRRDNKTRPDVAGQQPASSRRKKQICYLLDVCRGAVLLTRRLSSASLMPGMWELPMAAAGNALHPQLFRLRHSITVTDYDVRVLRASACPLDRPRNAEWIEWRRLPQLALTGLARKILRRAALL